VTEIQPTPRDPSADEFAPLNCPKCQAAMHMTPYVPVLGMFAERIFECSQCAHVLLMPQT
jgi:prepilin signal peptidase PulO-like enzyme (type II secretory pathway)